MPAISIIVPVYNAGRYLNECLESLTNQTLRNIEIICINDGSTDNSASILDEYAKKDSRIKVFSQSNKGPSSARNLGLDNVKGEYIAFVDSDDWVSVDMCEKIYKKAISTNADITLFPFFKIANNTVSADDRLENIAKLIRDDLFYLDSEMKEFVLNAPVETVGKLYKTSFLNKNNFRFPVNIVLGEDLCFFYGACLENASMTILNEPLYYYRVNTANSLIKRPDAVHILYKVLLNVKNKYLKSKIKNKKEFFGYFLRRITWIFIGYWNNCYTTTFKKTNYKYLKYLYELYKKFPHKDDSAFKSLKYNIDEYHNLFWHKLLEPIFEKEERSMRIVVYLFGKQVLNISRLKINAFRYNFYYTLTLWKLRIVSKFRKIRVGFWVVEPSKWTSQYLYDVLKKDKNFDPFILLSYFSRPQGELAPDVYYKKSREFFKQKNAKIYNTYDTVKGYSKWLFIYKADIIFYQQPWMIAWGQGPEYVYKHSLSCYMPYCFYSMNSYLNYLARFHGVLWKYFVETDMHKEEYKNIYHASNCIVVGSAKLDSYHFINKENAEKYWKTKGKKRVIYAPHHSFNDGLHEVATFKENGKFILELAKSHPETEWIFRPHPMFLDRIIKNSIMSLDEINEYYKEWEKIGTVSTSGNYYEMFTSSDVLITDCISFLSEYAPTLKPVIHLRKNYQKESFNSIVQKLDEGYYQVYTNDELEKTFKRLVKEGDDYLKTKREENLSILPMDTLANKNVYEYIKKELRIK